MNWKGWVLEIAVRGALPLLACLLTLVFLREPRRSPLAARLGGGTLAAAWLASRVAYGVLLYALLPWDGRADFQIWVARHAEPVLEGSVPGRDFRNGYGPLLPYLQAAGMGLLGHKAGVLLVFLAGDAVVVLATARLAGDLGGAAAASWARAWLVASPLLWHQAVVNGQDEPLFAAFLVSALLLLHRGKDAAGGALLGVGLAATKITFGLYGAAVALALLPDRKRFLRCAAAGLATTGAIHGAFVAVGATLGRYTTERHLQEHGHWGTSLVDTLRNVGLLHPETHRRLLPFLAAAAGLAVVALALRHRPGPFRPRAAAAGAAAHCVFALLVPGALVEYATQGLPFLVLLVAAGGGRWIAASAWMLPPVAALVALHYAPPDWAWPWLNTSLRLLCLALYGGTLWRAGIVGPGTAPTAAAGAGMEAAPGAPPAPAASVPPRGGASSPLAPRPGAPALP
jgi:hypothetical protein